MLSLLKKAFQGKRVFLTGHTGFKGTWMLHLLRHLGAHAYGYALPPESEDTLYALSNRHLCENETLEDIRHRQSVALALHTFHPDYVIHMAAQSLVRRSYQEPRQTFEVNFNGTLHLLEAALHAEKKEHPLVVLVVTTDKVYENPESGLPFPEDAPLGGHDPYSASKAACEILCASYRRSFMNDPKRFALLTVRAGNVIGGGDRAPDRLLPDIVRAWKRYEPVKLRYPQATRPWQHVLEPLTAYLVLMALAAMDPKCYAGAWNVGPRPEEKLAVHEAARFFCNELGALPPEIDGTEHPHEAQSLALSIDKIVAHTPWRPRLSMHEALHWTAAWEKDTRPASEKCYNDIRRYLELCNS
jgi:CDP-glucose 4,6-dehydratase